MCPCARLKEDSGNETVAFLLQTALVGVAQEQWPYATDYPPSLGKGMICQALDAACPLRKPQTWTLARAQARAVLHLERERERERDREREREREGAYVLPGG